MHWLFTISLLLSLVSIVVIMKLFYQYEQRFGMRSTSLLNVIGSNTIAIYTTHRILVEIFSLTLLAQMNAARWSPQVELTLLLVYPFVSLFICTVAGLLVRKLSQRAFSDLLFSPAFTARCRQLLPLSHRPSRGRFNLLNHVDYG